jgi:uncharacterized membrane protein
MIIIYFIFFSFVNNIYLNKKGFCLKIKTNELDQMNCAVSKKKEHLEYRKKLCNYLIKNETKFITFINNLNI